MRHPRLVLLLSALACFLAGAVHADDDMDRFLNERGLLTPPPSHSAAPPATPLPAPPAPTSSAVAPSDGDPSERRSELVVTAMGALGVPYRRGGNSYASGFDCSGFVRAVYEQTLGLTLPRQAAQQAAATQEIERSELQPGDLVFFNTLRRRFSHVGIYVGDYKFIHSPKPGAAVRIEDLRVNYWDRRFDGARRVVGRTADVPPQATASTSHVQYANY